MIKRDSQSAQVPLDDIAYVRRQIAGMLGTAKLIEERARNIDRQLTTLENRYRDSGLKV